MKKNDIFDSHQTHSNVNNSITFTDKILNKSKNHIRYLLNNVNPNTINKLEKCILCHSILTILFIISQYKYIIIMHPTFSNFFDILKNKLCHFYNILLSNNHINCSCNFYNSLIICNEQNICITGKEYMIQKINYYYTMFDNNNNKRKINENSSYQPFSLYQQWCYLNINKRIRLS